MGFGSAGVVGGVLAERGKVKAREAVQQGDGKSFVKSGRDRAKQTGVGEPDQLSHLGGVDGRIGSMHRQGRLRRVKMPEVVGGRAAGAGEDGPGCHGQL